MTLEFSLYQAPKVDFSAIDGKPISYATVQGVACWLHEHNNKNCIVTIFLIFSRYIINVIIKS